MLDWEILTCPAKKIAVTAVIKEKQNLTTEAWRRGEKQKPAADLPHERC
jgi:hypothetical protein